MSENTHSKFHVGYGGYVLIWLVLIGLTITTVAISGINLGNLTLVTALAIAAVKSLLVINIFMHIKFDDKLFKVFLIVALMTLLVAFVLTSTDIFFR
jgi:cytochrome c oxidase subunit 4